jgi:hypothetical protein
MLNILLRGSSFGLSRRAFLHPRYPFRLERLFARHPPRMKGQVIQLDYAGSGTICPRGGL